MSSFKIGEFTKEKKKFDWDEPSEVILKVEEELKELKTEIKRNDQGKIEEELGDLLFTVAQLSRHLGFCPEKALKSANYKFARRYNKMVERNLGEDIKNISGEKKEALWKWVKEEEEKIDEKL